MSLRDTSLGMILTLTITSVVVGGLLAGFYQLVAPRIEANRLAEEKRAIFAVLDGATGYEIFDKEIGSGEEKEVIRIFKGIGKEGELKGYAFVAEGPGFADKIVMMVGLNADEVTLSGLEVLYQIETPGLGNKIAEEKFESQFIGLHIKPKVWYVKNKKPTKPTDIQAITGATISSVVVVKAINSAITKIMPFIKNRALEFEVGQKAGEDSETVEGGLGEEGESAEEVKSPALQENHDEHDGHDKNHDHNHDHDSGESNGGER
ncbi:MAG: FMN-binding protein [Deltaproteobacteria bacterium]|nr:FMN-binding protein [Deltaproteobacteria bacterium]